MKEGKGRDLWLEFDLRVLVRTAYHWAIFLAQFPSMKSHLSGNAICYLWV